MLLEEIRAVVARDALDHGRQPLETRAGVDRGPRQRRHLAGRGAVELHEHEVPDLEPAPAAAGRIADGAAAGGVGSEIDVDLGAGPARARLAHRPEVLGLAEAHHPLRRQADRLAPQVVGLVVVAEHRRDEPVGVDAEVVGDEVPGVFDRLALEVVAEREVPEHLEEGVVARRTPDVLEVVVLARDAHALLRGGRGLVVAGLLAEEDALELHHARVREEQRRVGVGHQRRARDAPVSALLEEAQEELADLGGGERQIGPPEGGGRSSPQAARSAG